MKIAAHTCKFRRTKSSEWEYGIAIANNPGEYNVLHIVDEKGKLVKEPWSYDFLSSYGIMSNGMYLVDRPAT